MNTATQPGIPGLILHRLRMARKPLTAAEIISRILESKHPTLRMIPESNIKSRITGNLVHLTKRGEVVVIKPMGRPRKHNRRRFQYKLA